MMNRLRPLFCAVLSAALLLGQTTVLVTATKGQSQATAQVTAHSMPLVQSLTCTPANVMGGSTVTCTLVLSFAPTMPGGTNVAVTYTGGVTGGPTSVMVPAGAATTTFTFPAPAVAPPGTTGGGTVILPPPPVAGASNLSAVWANDGGDKVTREELRATKKVENLTGKVLNRTWNGTAITLAGARNETVSFNLVLEAAAAAASNVSVQFDTLTGPAGATIKSTAATGNGVFNWVNRPIELFYERYLPIKGVSAFGFQRQTWADASLPVRFRAASGQWADRPDHDRNYPDILVPLELVPTFSVAAGQNQGIWADVYVPKGQAPGAYTGNVVVKEAGTVTKTIPVTLMVYGFSLPDVPSYPGVVYYEWNGLNYRFSGDGYPNPDPNAGVRDKYFQLFRRHGMSLIGEYTCGQPADVPCAEDAARITGAVFDAAHGYAGRGAGLRMDVWSIGTYGVLTGGNQYFNSTQAAMWQHSDAWAKWFSTNAPGVDYFLYLMDEPSTAAQYTQVETWAKWLRTNTGPGSAMKSFSTLGASIAHASTPDLGISSTMASYGDPKAETDMAFFRGTGHELWHYNGTQPGAGCFVTECDGVALRTLGWAQYKKNIKRWFYWIVNTQHTSWTEAATWPANPVSVKSDPAWGRVLDSAGNGTWDSNGEGVLVYPGTDVTDANPANNYKVGGPFASMRLKAWRRGIQDADYLALAAAVNKTQTDAIVASVIPVVLWETGCPDSSCSWTKDGISWPTDPDAWESARAALAKILGN